MNPVCRVVLAVLLVCSTFGLRAETQGKQTLIGEARHVETGELLYREHHRIMADDHRVEYFNADGDLIATNTLDYQYSSVSPAHKQRDMRSETTQGARWEDDTLLLFLNDEEKSVDYREPLVISSGFDRFVREQWSALEDGQKVVFDFAVPTRLTTLQMRIERQPLQALGIDTPVEDWLAFKVQPDNFLVRWLGEPIHLVYDSNQRLRIYRGLSNLLDGQGRSQQVHIDYSYPSDPERDTGSAAHLANQLSTAELE